MIDFKNLTWTKMASIDIGFTPLELWSSRSPDASASELMQFTYNDITPQAVIGDGIYLAIQISGTWYYSFRISNNPNLVPWRIY